MSLIIERVIRFKEFKHDRGKFLVFGIPGNMSANYVNIFLWRLLEKKFGKKKTMEVLYNVGKFQALQGINIFNKRFGFAKKITNKKKLLEFGLKNFAFVGAGTFEIKRADIENLFFIITGKSNFAEEYKRFFGPQKAHYDDAMRGAFAGTVEAIFGKKVFCVKTRCISQGKPACEFVIKPLEKWNKNDPVFKEQYVHKLHNIEDLGAKINPYLL